MKMYGLEFLIASFIILIILFVHSFRRRRMNSINNRIFCAFIVFGTLDVVFDMLSTILISGDFPEYALLAKMVLTIFYILQIAMPCGMLCYTISLRQKTADEMKTSLVVSIIPAICMVIVVFYNFYSGIIFSFDAQGFYSHGKMYLLTYEYAVVYGTATLVGSIIHYSSLSRERFAVILEYIFVEVVSVLVQAITGHLVTGLGIALGIMVLYITINNPMNYTDAITGLFNKNYFIQWFLEQGNNKHSHIIVVEMYQLKQINKIFGVKIGNKILYQAAQELLKLSSTDNVFRSSGDQFILTSNTLEEYELQLRELESLFEKRFVIDEEELSNPAVICGIRNAGSQYKKDDYESYLEYLISSATKLNGVVVIESDEKTLKGFEYEKEIERFIQTAIEIDAFQVNYQPIYSIEEDQFVTLEALSRLRHPELGLVPTDLFISLAEKNGLIAKIGLLQFRRVCKFIHEHPELSQKIQNVKFNLSPGELMIAGHHRHLLDIMNEFDIPVSMIQFEITETVATYYSEKLYAIIEEFQKIGIALSLDDFGSGYANINTVLKLPFSSIKLDRSMLFGICDDAIIASFYKNIVNVLQNLGYKVVAEGVETKEEVELLKKWGVDMIQGYYYSRPVDEDTIIEMICKK